MMQMIFARKGDKIHFFDVNLTSVQSMCISDKGVKMKIDNIHLVYFSAAFTVRKTVRELASCFGVKTTVHDITCNAPAEDIILNEKDLLVIGMPVYAGRIPASAAGAIDRFKGTGTPAIAVCVYGNRDYDDALIELKDIIEANGFKAIAAAAFVAQHSIFPEVGAGRPDEEDLVKIRSFALSCKEKLASAEGTGSFAELHVKGNRPYRAPGNVPLHPSADRKSCTLCGTCARLCPAKAIPEEKPYLTDSSRCISCGHCMAVCPQKCRRYRGLLYKIAGKRFIKDNSSRKEPEMFL